MRPKWIYSLARGLRKADDKCEGDVKVTSCEVWTGCAWNLLTIKLAKTIVQPPLYDTFEARPLESLAYLFSPSQHKPTFCFSTKCNFLVSRSHLHLLIFIWILIVGGWWSEEVVSRSGRLMENMHFLIAISFGKAPALIGVSRAIITLSSCPLDQTTELKASEMKSASKIH